MVQLIQWGQQLEVGHPMIDADHQVLVDMMNKLLEAMLAGKDVEGAHAILDGLVAYTATHFAREEEAMQKRAYPDAAAHLAEHEAFRQEIGEFMDRLRAGDTMLTLGVMKFLKNWLTDHILTVDKRLAAYLNS